MNFYSIISKAYDLLDVIYFSEGGKNPRKVINDMICGEDKKVLDLCCGTLSNTIPIAKAKARCEILGIDLSKEMLKVARKKIEKVKADNVSLKCADATDTKLKSQSFDYVVIGLVLHECSEKLMAGMVLEARRLLKDDGKLIILEWERPKSIKQLIKFAPLHLGEIINNRLFNRFYYADKKEIFESYGFDLKEVRHCNYSIVCQLEKKQILSARKGYNTMGELTKLPNIGKEIEKQLNDVGISSYEELKSCGAEQAWLKIQEIDESACINRLLSLEGAIKGVKKTLLSDERKAELKDFYYWNKK